MCHDTIYYTILVEVRITVFYVYKPDSHSLIKWGCSSGVERALRMREAPGSIPGISTLFNAPILSNPGFALKFFFSNL